MLRKVVAALFLLVLGVGITLADEIRAVIIKVDGGKVTFAETKRGGGKGKAEKGPEQTLSVTDNLKVFKGTYNKDTKKLEAGDAIEGGLKHEMFSKIDSEKGLQATVVTDNNKITEIRVGGRGRRGGK